MSLEREAAWFEQPAFELALSQFELDLWQTAARRLEILLMAAFHSRAEVSAIQHLLAWAATLRQSSVGV
jgi:hypothetical protein